FVESTAQSSPQRQRAKSHHARSTTRTSSDPHLRQRKTGRFFSQVVMASLFFTAGNDFSRGIVGLLFAPPVEIVCARLPLERPDDPQRLLEREFLVYEDPENARLSRDFRQ